MENKNHVPKDEPSDDTKADIDRQLMSSDIPQLVGQIASLVRSHFQEQINHLVNEVASIKDDLLKIKDQNLVAKIVKIETFAEKIHSDLYNHRHEKGNA